MKTFNIRLQVEDPLGAPLAGARVRLVRTSRDGGYCAFPRFNAARGEPVTDANGRLEWREVEAEIASGERYVLSVRHPRFAEALVQRPGAEVRVRLERGAELAACAGDASGAPIAGARVTTYWLDGGGDVPVCHAVLREATTDAGGRATLVGLRRGRHRVVVEHAAYVAADLEADAGGRLDVVLASGRSLRGTAPAGAAISVTWDAGDAHGEKTATCDAEGTFDLPGLPADVALTCDARDADGAWIDRTIVATDDDAPVVLDGRRLARVRGTAAGAEVVFAWAGRECLGSAEVEAGGAFAIALPPGRALLYAGTAEQRCEGVLALDLAPGERRDAVALPVRALDEATVRVMDAMDGRPVPRATVSLEQWVDGALVELRLRDCAEAGSTPMPLPTLGRLRLEAYADGYQKATRVLEPAELEEEDARRLRLVRAGPGA